MQSVGAPEIERLKRRLERERRAREEAETLLEGKSRELYESANELKKANNRLRNIAYKDPVTGLPNRLVIEKALSTMAQKMPEQDNVSALYHLDLNDFNTFVGRLGHASGDDLLRQVAGRIQDVAPPNAIAARLGGDEFAVLDIGSDADSRVQGFAKRLVDALSHPYDLSGGTFFCSASCGVATVSTNAEQGVTQWFADAEIALNHAKVNNRGGFIVFNDAFRHQKTERLVSREEVYSALQSRQFEVWLQPQIDLRTQILAGYEALVRWKHPDRGIVSPGHFCRRSNIWDSRKGLEILLARRRSAC